MKSKKHYGTNFHNFIVSVASWEERFLEGTKKLINANNPDCFLMSYCNEYAELSKDNRDEIVQFCEKKSIKVIETSLSFKDPVASWNSTKKMLFSNELRDQKVTLDITTMPRETIWTTLSFLEVLNCNISYIYCKPESYNDNWLSQEPSKPRIVFKLGGISTLGHSTVLVILSGYDIDRVNQLINYFDPEITLIGIQSGRQMKNEEKNIAKCEAEFKNHSTVKLFQLDAYSPDHGYKIISSLIEPYIPKHNIILSSLGPKLSAIALYKLQKTHPSIALAYAPSKKFNPEYSFGLGNAYVGNL